MWQGAQPRRQWPLLLLLLLLLLLDLYGLNHHQQPVEAGQRLQALALAALAEVAESACHRPPRPK